MERLNPDFKPVAMVFTDDDLWYAVDDALKLRGVDDFTKRKELIWQAQDNELGDEFMGKIKNGNLSSDEAANILADNILRKPLNEAVNADVTNLQSITQQTPSMQSANTRIDTPDEFKSAFVIFVANTGLYQKGMIKTPADVQTWVHDALVNPKFGFQIPQKK